MLEIVFALPALCCLLYNRLKTLRRLCFFMSPHLHFSELAAGIYYGLSLCLWRELIRCADVCPILSGASSVNTICAFHFSRQLSPPSVTPTNPLSTLASPLAGRPVPYSPLVLYPLVPVQI